MVKLAGRQSGSGGVWPPACRLTCKSHTAGFWLCVSAFHAAAHQKTYHTLTPKGSVMIPRTLAALVLGLATPAAAQDMCAPLADGLATLLDRYGEQTRVTGLGADGRMFIVTAAPSGTWTMLIVDANMIACLVTHGEAFQITAAGTAS